MRYLVACVVVLGLTSSVLAETWTVDDDGPADFDNIQAAVDAASDGDEIIVMPGTYTSTQDGHVVNMLGIAVTLRSSDPSNPDVVAATIIDGEDARRGIACFNGETSNTIISGFTITNGYAVGFDYNGDGEIDDYDDVCGGGMFNFGSPTLTNCTFTNNFAAWKGGGMFNWECNPTLTNCTFTNNTADYGGGMGNDNSSPALTDCTFTGNTAIYGGGMSNSLSSPTLENCIFEGNNGYNIGGGMTNWQESSPTLTNCTFIGNTADNDGGGMQNWQESSPTLTDCTFENNTATDSGGGMHNWNNSSPTLTGCTFTGNTADDNGGGMRNENNSNPTLTDTTVCGNTPDQIIGDWTGNGGNTIADECPSDCPADINGDGNVGVDDLLAVIASWNDPYTVNDLLLVISEWGNTCP